jgi:DNA-binding CsgD family transcriptional regulator
MTALSEEAALAAEESRILNAFTRGLIEISARARPDFEAARDFDVPNDFGASKEFAASKPASALNVLRQPALLLGLDGAVLDVNMAAVAVFGADVKVKDGRLLIRDMSARTEFQTCLHKFADGIGTFVAPEEPIVVPRQDRLPVLLRMWPFHAGVRRHSRDMFALVTLIALGPRPGPPASIVAKIFGLTPSEAKLSCIIARGVGPETAAKELKISRETARNQLKSVFGKTGTHRQSELVALILQVE